MLDNGAESHCSVTRERLSAPFSLLVLIFMSLCVCTLGLWESKEVLGEKRVGVVRQGWGSVGRLLILGGKATWSQIPFQNAALGLLGLSI